MDFTAEDLERLREWDTPTICNALELVAPDRRGFGFTRRPLVAANRALKPICGLARTGTIRAAHPSGRGRDADRAARIGWYEYVAAATLPTIVVQQDLDDPPGIGAFWGEVNSAVHLGLGAQGVITNGSIRDIEMWAPGFQGLAGMVNPSHAYVHVVAWGAEVGIHGMTTRHDDIIHADHHGAVIIPREALRSLPAAIDLGARREKVILDMARAPGFTIDHLREALSRADDIH
jgi:hypothetical protein